MNTHKAQSLRRLARDARELAAAADAMPFVTAAPHGDDLHEWRVSFTAPDGPYNGVLLHAVLTIPDDYPSTPPIVRLCTKLPHPNVYEGVDFNTHRRASGVFICLSMLMPREEGGGGELGTTKQKKTLYGMTPDVGTAEGRSFSPRELKVCCCCFRVRSLFRRS